jgi:hypothetical protein
VFLGAALAIVCGAPGEGPGAEGSATETGRTTGAATAEIAFANHCSSTSPDVRLVTPTEAEEWQASEAPYCVVLDDTADDYGRFDPLELEGPCSAADSVPPWESSKELYVVVTAAEEGPYTLHVATRIEETDDERCVGCYPEESGCAGTSAFRDLSRDVSLSMPAGGGSRVVSLTEIQGLDFERQVLSLALEVGLQVGDSVVARDSLAPVWARCC